MWLCVLWQLCLLLCDAAHKVIVILVLSCHTRILIVFDGFDLRQPLSVEVCWFLTDLFAINSHQQLLLSLKRRSIWWHHRREKLGIFAAHLIWALIAACKELKCFKVNVLWKLQSTGEIIASFNLALTFARITKQSHWMVVHFSLSNYPLVAIMSMNLNQLHKLYWHLKSFCKRSIIFWVILPVGWANFSPRQLCAPVRFFVCGKVCVIIDSIYSYGRFRVKLHSCSAELAAHSHVACLSF